MDKQHCLSLILPTEIPGNGYILGQNTWPSNFNFNPRLFYLISKRIGSIKILHFDWMWFNPQINFPAQLHQALLRIKKVRHMAQHQGDVNIAGFLLFTFGKRSEKINALHPKALGYQGHKLPYCFYNSLINHALTFSIRSAQSCAKDCVQRL